ncbi:MAG TPA: apolipoprotein N-acyltransferase [Candidatus Eisenbacteria bacterium]|jgi:apolipoprotein N-acyltransferase
MRSIARPSKARRSGSPDRGAVALALVSGALLGAAFLPAPLGFLAWFAYVPLLVALDRAVAAGAGALRLFGLGYAFGLAFYLVGTHWIALLSDVAITVPWLKYPAWIAAALYLALFGGLTALGAGLLGRAARAPLALVFPPVLVAVEELRGSGELGFPWFQPGYSQHQFAPLVQLASLGSVTLVTLWLGLVNGLAWRALAGRSRLRSAAGALLALLLPWLWGERVLDAAPRTTGPPVALVQGNIAGEIKWSGHHQQAILDTFLALSARAAQGEPRPSLIVWPETATGSYTRKQPEQAIAIARFVARDSVPVFSGYADYEIGPGGRVRAYNAAGLFAPGGGDARAYAKRHLVPFGERMPFQWLIPALGKIELGQAEWTPGREAVLFPSEAGPFGALICFESIFPDLAREEVRRGARWLVNVTNDEWFGNGAALHQHAAMALFRAAEHHVPLARCANTGLTVMVDAYGRITHRLPVFQAASLTAPLPSPGPPTLYTRLGDWPGLLCALALALLAVKAVAKRGPRSGS